MSFGVRAQNKQRHTTSLCIPSNVAGQIPGAHPTGRREQILTIVRRIEACRATLLSPPRYYAAGFTLVLSLLEDIDTNT